MKIKINVSLAGIDFAYVEGDIVEVKDKLAKNWIKAGVASPVKSEPPVERAEQVTEVETPEPKTKVKRKK